VGFSLDHRLVCVGIIIFLSTNFGGQQMLGSKIVGVNKFWGQHFWGQQILGFWGLNIVGLKNFSENKKSNYKFTI
jgi:hypothetical protein